MALLQDIWRSFLRMPLWVKIWVFGILFPMNVTILMFYAEPGWAVVAALVIGGILPNIPLMFAERGFTTSMAVPHTLFWTPLLAVLAYQIWLSDLDLSGFYRGYLSVLLITNAISLAMDIPDTFRWLRGNRRAF